MINKLWPQETLINMLQCFDFVQSPIKNLKSHLPEISMKGLFYWKKLNPFDINRRSFSNLFFCEDSEWDRQMPECNTSPQFLKVKRKHTYSRLNKTTGDALK